MLHNKPFISFLENKICRLRFVPGQAICGEKYLFINTLITAKSITERAYNSPDMTSQITWYKVGRQKGRESVHPKGKLIDKMYLLNFVLNNKGTIIIVGGGGARMPKYNEMLLSGKTVEMLLRFFVEHTK